jgi:hypothetical protein
MSLNILLGQNSPTMYGNRGAIQSVLTHSLLMLLYRNIPCVHLIPTIMLGLAIRTTVSIIFLTFQSVPLVLNFEVLPHIVTLVCYFLVQ